MEDLYKVEFENNKGERRAVFFPIEAVSASLSGFLLVNQVEHHKIKEKVPYDSYSRDLYWEFERDYIWVPKPPKDQRQSALLAPECSRVFTWVLQEDLYIKGIHIEKGDPAFFLVTRLTLGAESLLVLGEYGFVASVFVEGRMGPFPGKKGMPLTLELTNIDGKERAIELSYINVGAGEV